MKRNRSILVLPALCIAAGVACAQGENERGSADTGDAPSGVDIASEVSAIRPVTLTHTEVIGADPSDAGEMLWPAGLDDAYLVRGCYRSTFARAWSLRSDEPAASDGESSPSEDETERVPLLPLKMPEPLDYRLAVMERWNAQMLERSRLLEMRLRDDSSLRDAARWDLGNGWDIGASGEERPLHNEESYYAISAETQLKVAPSAELRFGYDLLRKGVPGVLDELDVSKEGVFLKFQWRF